MKLTKVQREAVNDIVDHWKAKEIRELVFKAPTGSGKTFMVASIIDQIISLNNEKKLFFIIATPSSAELPKQFFDKLNKYKTYLNNIDIKIELVESPSNNKMKKDYNFFLKPEENKVMIFGKSSFGKKRIFTEEGIIDALFDELKNDDSFELIYIRDEAHIGTKISRAEIENFESNILKVAKFIIKMSATVNKNDHYVEITERDLIEDDEVKLLKEKLVYNEGIVQNDIEYDSNSILHAACKKFREIKDQYDATKEEGLSGINPAMLIQVKNSDKNDPEEQKIQNLVKGYQKIIESYGWNWATYFGDDKNTSSQIREKVTLNNLSQNNSSFDVIFFKVGPATGWDIPRATMLVQLRNVCSESLNIQTIGRIKRNPNPWYPFKRDSIVFKYFIYSDKKLENSDILKWNLKSKFKEEKVLSGSLEVELYNGTSIFSKDVIDDQSYKNAFIKLLDEHDFEVSFEEYKEKYNLEKKLPGDVRFTKYSQNQSDPVKFVEFWIYNSIDLKLYVERQWEKLDTYLKYFPYQYDFWKDNLFLEKEELDSPIFQKFNELLEIYKDDLMFSWDFYRYIIIKNLIPSVKRIYKESIETKSKELKSYKLNWNNLNEMLTFTKDKESKGYPKLENISDIENKFIYELENKSQSEIKILSDREWQFINDCKRFVKYITEKNTNINSFSWTLNAANGNLGFEYLVIENQRNLFEDESKKITEIKKSFPDFLTIINEKHLIFLEVKAQGQEDYNREKTKSLLKTYKKYVEAYKNNFFSLTNDKLNNKKFKSFTMVVVSYSNFSSNESPTIRGASTNEKIQKKLDSNISSKRFNGIKDLFIEISEIN
ncbi:DEAD/DEAH box helicase [Mycoplasmopsis synoviae]|uniref:DEAD/DEAH box helicase n=1 Tax=Mycoplasmopsis synoviae TaxID=2109 RepID=UPI003564D4E1